jgi:hypothetical protein
VLEHCGKKLALSETVQQQQQQNLSATAARFACYSSKTCASWMPWRHITWADVHRVHYQSHVLDGTLHKSKVVKNV